MPAILRSVPHVLSTTESEGISQEFRLSHRAGPSLATDASRVAPLGASGRSPERADRFESTPCQADRRPFRRSEMADLACRRPLDGYLTASTDEGLASVDFCHRPLGPHRGRVAVCSIRGGSSAPGPLPSANAKTLATELASKRCPRSSCRFSDKVVHCGPGVFPTCLPASARCTASRHMSRWANRKGPRWDDLRQVVGERLFWVRFGYR